MEPPRLGDVRERVKGAILQQQEAQERAIQARKEAGQNIAKAINGIAAMIFLSVFMVCVTAIIIVWMVT